MRQKRVRLIVGLGNPGNDYLFTRHNVGFMTVDLLADCFSISFDKNKFSALFGRGSINGNEVILVKPMAFMNRSGIPIQNVASYFKIHREDILIIHDDIDIDFGRIKIKRNGGAGGHNGVKSIIDAFGDGDFARVRVGIKGGGERGGANVANYVLGKFSFDEMNSLDQIIAKAKDAVVTVVCKNITTGMNKFNDKKNIL